MKLGEIVGDYLDVWIGQSVIYQNRRTELFDEHPFNQALFRVGLFLTLHAGMNRLTAQGEARALELVREVVELAAVRYLLRHSTDEAHQRVAIAEFDRFVRRCYESLGHDEWACLSTILVTRLHEYVLTASTEGASHREPGEMEIGLDFAAFELEVLHCERDLRQLFQRYYVTSWKAQS
jgi:hypothetical protein